MNHPYVNSQPNAPFSPNVISDLSLWLDGSDPLNTGIAPATGTPISTWFDKSTNSYNATQTTTSNQPTFHSGGGVYFHAAGPNSTFLNTSIPVGNSTTCFFVTSTSSVPNSYLYYSGNNTEIIMNFSGVPIKSFAIGGDDGIFLNAGSPIPPINLYNFTRTGAVSKSGYYMGSNAFSSPAMVYSPAVIYSLSFSNSPFDGVIYEMIIYNRAITDAERQKVEGYLAWKWGINTSLPVSHPYSTSPPISTSWKNIVNLGASAANTSYTPANSTLWSNPAPTTVANAIDRLATAINTINGSLLL